MFIESQKPNEQALLKYKVLFKAKATKKAQQACIAKHAQYTWNFKNFRSLFNKRESRLLLTAIVTPRRVLLRIISF